MSAAGVFEIGHKDFVAGFHVDAVGADIHTGGGAADDGDFFEIGADEFGEVAEDLVLLRGEEAVAVVGIGDLHFEGFDEGVVNWFGHGSEGAVVHHDEVVIEEEVFADAVPVNAIGGLLELLVEGGEVIIDGCV